MTSPRPPWLRVAPEVNEALEAGRPVLAFESTVIAHGLPHPRNVDVALAMEGIARDAGCVPATVAVAGGEVLVGLTKDQVNRLATEEGVTKVNLSNLAASLAQGRLGATTVATTMLACDLAGIEMFATGGIGGVHPGAATHFDISSDLTALATFRVSVVSAGAKSILDLSATLEALETRGVPVIGIGTDRFPAFHVPSSDLPVDARVDTAEGAAAIIRAHRSNPRAAGLLLANPIPPESALPAQLIREATARAERDARAEGVRGRALTPYLLERLEHHTGTRSLEANVALLRHNAEVGASIARALRP